LDREGPAVIGYNGGAAGGGNLVSDPSTSRRALLAGAALVVAGSANAESADDPAQLLALMERYAAGLRWGAADGLVALYTSDGVFIRDDLPAAVGTEALRAAYRQMFATLKVDLAFEIKETEVAGDMAWLRATSAGRINSVVIFRRTTAGWRIRCFVYNAGK
jgi:ketosteroid isomerase-like protein